MDAVFSTISQIRQPLAVGILLLLLLWESSHPFFGFFRNRTRERSAHALRNLLLGILNVAVVAVGFVGLLAAITAWTARESWGLFYWVPLPAWAQLLAAILILDAWTYAWHRMNHEFPFFWKFHRVHHSDPHMDVTTANRFHLGEIVFSSLLRCPILFLSGIPLWILALYEALMFANTQVHHANIGLPRKVDRILSWFITTPGMHKVHHSRLQPETDSNYTALFSIWDRLFRTFRHHPHPESIQFGLDEFNHPADQNLSGLIKTPFKKPPASKT